MAWSCQCCDKAWQLWAGHASWCCCQCMRQGMRVQNGCVCDKAYTHGTTSGLIVPAGAAVQHCCVPPAQDILKATRKGP
eukprot:1158185-Pelagomonas_calceolata.AAC.8